MDALYLFKHSISDDFELRYSLRSLAQNAPYIRKVWVFGDDPGFLATDQTIIEYVPHASTASALGAQTPVVNFFLLTVLGAMIPDLSPEFLLMSDDFFLCESFPIESARKVRYLKDLATTEVRGTGRWKNNLWFTYDLLVLLGYTGFNFETHTPSYLQRDWVTAAYADFKPYVSQQRLKGMLGLTAILNHAYKAQKMALTSIADEQSRFGFWGKPPTAAEIAPQSVGKTFFNCDDGAFGATIQSFLAGRFPAASRYEKA